MIINIIPLSGRGLNELHLTTIHSIINNYSFRNIHQA